MHPRRAQDFSGATLFPDERFCGTPPLPPSQQPADDRHCYPPMRTPIFHGRRFSFLPCQPSTNQHLYPDRASPTADGQTQILEHRVLPQLADSLTRIQECWKAETQKRHASSISGTFGRQVSEELASKVFSTNARESDTRNGSRYLENDRRICLQLIGQMETDREREVGAGKRKEVAIFFDEEFKPARKRLFAQEEPENFLHRECTGLAKESRTEFAGQGQLQPQHGIRSTYGNICRGFHSSVSNNGAPSSEKERDRQAEAQSWGSQLHMGHGRFAGKVKAVSNGILVQQRHGLCLELTLTSQPESMDIKLPMIDHEMNSPKDFPDIAVQALAFPCENEGSVRKRELVDFMAAAGPSGFLNPSEENFDENTEERPIDEDLQQQNRQGVAYSLVEHRLKLQQMGWDGDLRDQLGEGAGDSFDVFSLKSSVAPSREANLVSQSEGKFSAFIDPFQIDLDGKQASGEELAFAKTTLPPLDSYEMGKKQHSACTMEDGEMDSYAIEERQYSACTMEDGVQTLDSQGSSSDSQVSYESNGKMTAEPSPEAAVGLCCSESLGNTDCHGCAGSLPQILEAQLDTNHWSEESTCRSNQADGTNEMLSSTNKKFSQGKVGAPEGIRITHGALDLLVDAVQVALAPMIQSNQEACASTDERQESERVGIFVHGGIPIPQKRVSRQARSTGKRKARSMKLEHEKAQIMGLEHKASDLADEGDGRTTTQELPPDEMIKKQIKSPPVLVGLVDPFIQSKRGRTRTLPSRFRDSVLEPWKKGFRKTEGLRYGGPLQLSGVRRRQRNVEYTA